MSLNGLGPSMQSGGDADMDAFADHGPTNVLISIVVPLVLIVVGVATLIGFEVPTIAQHTFADNDQYRQAFGVMAIGAAVFLHFRGYWQFHRPDVWYSVLGQIIGLLGVISGAAMVMLRFVRVI